ncbi:MAG TPA: hypothetical protein VGI65_04980, partial [Steroidobacteraceae bacterium]
NLALSPIRDPAISRQQDTGLERAAFDQAQILFDGRTSRLNELRSVVVMLLVRDDTTMIATAVYRDVHGGNDVGHRSVAGAQTSSRGFVRAI